MDTARGLSVPLVCLDLGPLPEPPPQARPRPRISNEMAGAILLPAASRIEAADPPATPGRAHPGSAESVSAAMEELGRHADRYGVVLALRSDLSSLAAIEKVMADAGCPWFGLDLDPVAVLRDAWDMDETLSRLGSLIRHVRGRDALSGADRRTRPTAIGRGETPWPQLLADLDAAGYAGWMTIDPTDLADRLNSASAAVTFLNSLS